MPGALLRRNASLVTKATFFDIIKSIVILQFDIKLRILIR